jgi:hypothetical protein
MTTDRLITANQGIIEEFEELLKNIKSKLQSSMTNIS